jgi:hypothetical protein
VPVISTAGSVGHPEFRDLLIDGYNLSLIPDATVKFVELINGYMFLI